MVFTQHAFGSVGHTALLNAEGILSSPLSKRILALLPFTV